LGYSSQSSVYLLSNDKVQENRLLSWDEEGMDLEQILCPVFPEHQRGGKRTSPLVIAQPKRELVDLNWSWYSEPVISERLAIRLRRENITGFDLAPVYVARQKNMRSAALFELIVTGWGGAAPPKTGIELVESCEHCGFLTYAAQEPVKRIFDPKKWEGQDFFIIWPLPAFVLVTARVREIFSEFDLGGTTFEPVDQWKISGEMSPGRLSYWMPEKRARELGAPLGID
jgi:hypothetical protein